MRLDEESKEFVSAEVSNPNILEDLQHYNDEVKSILFSEDPVFVSLSTFVSMSLKQFNLSGRFWKVVSSKNSSSVSFLSKF